MKAGNRVPRFQIGLGQNLAQFSLLVVVNAFVGAMVGMERSILPLIAENEFALKARIILPADFRTRLAENMCWLPGG